MASKIKGITIEVGGDTSKLQKSLNQIQAPINKINSELKNVNQALKFDPKNTELLVQKQEILARNIQATREKLEALKKAQEELGPYANLTEQQKQNYNRLSAEIGKTENALKQMNGELRESTKIDLSKLKDGLKKIGEVAVEVSKKLLQVSGAIAGALSSIVTLGVKSYASLEQNIGGIQKLFGDSADELIKKSQEAYKTAGLSANTYMETATSFSASLLKGLDGDTQKAVELTDRAIQDMADNANTFGSSMDEVMNVYKALSKEQYTTLDNLRLGYAGTKTGMQELIKDASSYTEIQKELGITVDASSMSFDNIINAISVMQKHLNITGTTMKEAEGTITGSINMMKGAFENFINGSGSPEALADSMLKVINNVMEAVKKLAPNILQGIIELVATLIPEVGKILIENIPLLLDSITSMIDELLDLLSNNTEGVQKAVTDLINKVVLFITDNLPKILEIAILLIVTLARGIAESLPTIIPAVIQCILTIVQTLLENLDLIIDAGIELIMALIDAITNPDTLNMIIEAVPTIIESLIEGIITNLPKLIMVGPKLILKLVEAIIKNLPTLLTLGPKIILSITEGIMNSLSKIGSTAGEIIKTIKEKLSKLPEQALNWGKDLINGFVKGIKNNISNITNAVKGIGDKIKNFLHFSRPDEGPLRDYETWMPDFIKGLADGIKKSSYLLEDASLGLANDISTSIIGNTSQALKGLNAGINSSMNPTINPTYAYDLNYKLLASAIIEGLKETKVELDDREVGRFVDNRVSEEVFN